MALQNNVLVDQKKLDMIANFLVQTNGRTIVTRKELHSLHHNFNPMVSSTPQWISKNEAAWAKNEKGERMRGFFDLTVFKLKAEVVTVPAPAEVKLVDAVIDATAEIAAPTTVETSTEVVTAPVTIDPDGVAVVSELSPAAKARAEKRAAKKAAKSAK
jgi:hypothetical protein